jgi:hypothetical protein
MAELRDMTRYKSRKGSDTSEKVSPSELFVGVCGQLGLSANELNLNQLQTHIKLNEPDSSVRWSALLIERGRDR